MAKIYVFINTMVLFTAMGQNPESELRLREFLFSNHSNAIRPVSNLNQSIEIVANLELYALNRFDTINGILVTQCSLELTWYDRFLSWEPNQYSNISMIYVSSKEVWKPIIIICNAETAQVVQNEVSDLVLHSDGRVVFWFQEILRTFCTIDAHGYPFDKQRCHILVCVAIHKAEHVIIKRLYYRKARFFKNYQWDVEMQGMKESEDNAGRSMTRATILISRRIKINTIALMIPSAIFTVISVFVFLLPTESGEKVSLATTLFLSIIVYLVEIDKETPKNSETMPLITLYLLTLAVLSGFNTIGAIVESRIYVMLTKKLDPQNGVSVCNENQDLKLVSSNMGSNQKADNEERQAPSGESEVDLDGPNTKLRSIVTKDQNPKKLIDYNRYQSRHQKLSRIFFSVSVVYIITSIITICLTNSLLTEGTA